MTMKRPRRRPRARIAAAVSTVTCGPPVMPSARQVTGCHLGQQGDDRVGDQVGPLQDEGVPATGHPDELGPGIPAASSMPSWGARRRSFSPTITTTGILPSVGSEPRLSQAHSIREATTSMGVALIICSRKVTANGLTSPSPNPISRVPRNDKPGEMRRPRSARAACSSSGRAVQHERERAGQRGPDLAGHPRAAALQPAGRGVDEHGPSHLRAEHARMLPGQSHDRHAAHE